MTTWRGFILFKQQGVGLTSIQKQRLLQRAALMGSKDHSNPAYRNQIIISRTGSEVIVEASFNRAEIGTETIYAAIANAFGVTVTQVKNRLSVTLFGGTEAGYAVSLAAVRNYIRLHTDEWVGGT